MGFRELVRDINEREKANTKAHEELAKEISSTQRIVSLLVGAHNHHVSLTFWGRLRWLFCGFPKPPTKSETAE